MLTIQGVDGQNHTLSAEIYEVLFDISATIIYHNDPYQSGTLVRLVDEGKHFDENYFTVCLVNAVSGATAFAGIKKKCLKLVSKPSDQDKIVSLLMQFVESISAYISIEGEVHHNKQYFKASLKQISDKVHCSTVPNGIDVYGEGNSTENAIYNLATTLSGLCIKFTSSNKEYMVPEFK